MFGHNGLIDKYAEINLMRTVFIFHGTAGSPEGNWFPWLKEELEKRGCRVFVPEFLTPDGQSLASWLEVLKDYDQFINKETIFIGHSLGGLFLLRVLERLKHSVYAAFFVAAPVGVRPILFYESDYRFSGFSFDWSAIKSKAKHFTVFHSDNDPYVCLANGEKLAKELGANLIFIPNAGHLNAESGYTRFDKLLQEMDKILNLP